MKVVSGWVVALILAIGAGVGIEATLGPPLKVGSAARSTAPQREAVRLAYGAAKEQWIGSFLTDGFALQPTALQVAIADLRSGETKAGRDASAYAAAIKAMQGYESIPITGVTAADLAGLRYDSVELARFFGLPAMTTGPRCSMPPRSPTSPAYTEWLTEPTDIASGIQAAPLRRAASDLEADMKADPAGTSCFPAAIADLEALASTPGSAVAASSRSVDGGCTYSVVGDEIAYLSWFFVDLGGNSVVLVSGACE